MQLGLNDGCGLCLKNLKKKKADVLEDILEDIKNLAAGCSHAANYNIPLIKFP